MNLDHTPHPEVENHYHVRELIERQEKRTRDRINWQNQKKAEDSFLKAVAGFKDIETLDFHCSHCNLDFVARAKKQIDSWAEIAYYKTKHRCGTWAIRHITDRYRDSYFERSRRVAYDRGVNAINMVQSFETGYNMLYGKR